MKHIAGLVLVTALSVTGATAMELPNNKNARKIENAGFGLGAIIGGLLGGPPGAVLGAAGGTWLGAHTSKNEDEIASLGKRLQEKEQDLARLGNEFASLQTQFTRDLQKARLEQTSTILDQLAHGISMSVYFRTNSTEINPDIQPAIINLANSIRQYPEIQVYLYGYADRRGTKRLNQDLSQKRIMAIQRLMMYAGIQEQRIHTYAYGETRALVVENDKEGLVFDRRVAIHLTPVAGN